MSAIGSVIVIGLRALPHRGFVPDRAAYGMPSGPEPTYGVEIQWYWGGAGWC
ncbi:MAG: hypothetical protein IPJ15_13705 [Actinomycetales bacterium]|nr:hypothetical protein [Candidatus Phosphoribacter baldrii]